MTDDEEDDGMDEDLLLRQLASHLVQASPAKHPVLLRDDSPEPPIRDALTLEEEEQLVHEDDEADLLARALHEEQHLFSQTLKEHLVVGSPAGGVSASSALRSQTQAAARQLTASRRLNLDDEAESASPPLSLNPPIIKQRKSAEDLREEQILIEILEKASSEFQSGVEFKQNVQRTSRDAGSAHQYDPRPIDLEKKTGEKRNEKLERARLRALIKELKAEVAKERSRAEAAETRVADLYAQRFVLGMVCAASVPPLGFALLAHRYDLHDWEARSDALGVLLVVMIVLFFAALSLWRKARTQFEAAPVAANERPNQAVASSGQVNFHSTELGPPPSSQSTGLRKRTSKRSVPVTKTEAVL